MIDDWRLKIGVALLAIAAAASCARTEPPKQYPLTGQILAVHAAKQELTIKHDDIPNFMPAMTMTYPVANAAMMKDREPGELISGTLEVQESTGRLITIVHKGSAPLPANTNEVAMAEGLLEVGDEVPDAALVDQTDRRRSFSEWKGSLTLVTFIYTNCPLPNYCPLMDQNFSTIQRAVAEDPQLKGRVKLVSISFDPERDTPATLAAHAAKRRADPAVWTFLTGDRVTIDRFAGRFGVAVIRTDGQTDIAHSLRTMLIGADGRIRAIYRDNSWTPSTVLSDLRAAASSTH